MRTKLIRSIVVASIASLPLTSCGAGGGSVGVGEAVDYKGVFNIDRSELRNVKDESAPEQFQEGSSNGHTRFESSKDLTPRGFENYKLLADNDPERQYVIQDFNGLFPEDREILNSKQLRVYTHTTMNMISGKKTFGTTRDFMVEPVSHTYFYQWQIPEYKKLESPRWKNEK